MSDEKHRESFDEIWNRIKNDPDFLREFEEQNRRFASRFNDAFLESLFSRQTNAHTSFGSQSSSQTAEFDFCCGNTHVFKIGSIRCQCGKLENE